MQALLSPFTAIGGAVLALLAEAGRGLQVVEALSAAWGWTRLTGRRKAVWAALPLPVAAAGTGECHSRSA